jgi:hypothetical protein
MRCGSRQHAGSRELVRCPARGEPAMPIARGRTASSRTQSRCNSTRYDVDSAARKFSVVAPLGKPQQPRLRLRVRLDARRGHLYPRHALQHVYVDHVSDWIVVSVALFPVVAAKRVVHVPDALYRDAAVARRTLQLVKSNMRSCGISWCAGWSLSVSLWGPLGFGSLRVWPFVCQPQDVVHNVHKACHVVDPGFPSTRHLSIHLARF